MSKFTSFFRLSLTAILLASLSGANFPVAYADDAATPQLMLRPHCTETDPTKCAPFETQDPLTLITPILGSMQMLNMDVVLQNPGHTPISKVRIWLSYDPEVLQGTSLTIAPEFPNIVPGESDFTAFSGYAKIGASADAGKE